MIDLIKEFDLNFKNVYSIIGISKNSGKTTLLNYLIKNIEKNNKNYLITSIGYDGESVDLVTETEKPSIYINKNNYFITYRKFINEISHGLEIIKNIKNESIFGDLYLCKSISYIKTKITGPQNNIHMKNIIKFAKDLIDYFLIDGALDRSSSCSPLISNGYILVISPSYYNSENELKIGIENLYYKNQIIEEVSFENIDYKLKYNIEIEIYNEKNSKIANINIPLINLKNYIIEKDNIFIFYKNKKIYELKISSIIGNEEKIYPYLKDVSAIYFPKALTEISLKKIYQKLLSDFDIYLLDPTKNFLSYSFYKMIKNSNIRLYYFLKPTLKGIISSTFHPQKKLLINPKYLKKLIASYFKGTKIIDLFYDN
jgi:hypothetical protein